MTYKQPKIGSVYDYFGATIEIIKHPVHKPKHNHCWVDEYLGQDGFGRKYYTEPREWHISALTACRLIRE
jgi:hypothetical protein